MPKQIRSNPQETVLAALKKSGTNSNAGLNAALEGVLDGKQISNALWNLGKAGKIVVREEEGRRVYTYAGLVEKSPRKAAKTPAKAAKAQRTHKDLPKRKTAPKGAKLVDTRSIDEINQAARRAAARHVVTATPEPELMPRPAFAPEGFRVGLFSDGGLAIVADDTEMHLDAAQTRALIGFLEHTTVLRARA